jgi:hypothetical protein
MRTTRSSAFTLALLLGTERLCPASPRTRTFRAAGRGVVVTPETPSIASVTKPALWVGEAGQKRSALAQGDAK